MVMRQMRANTKWIMAITSVFFVGFMAFQGVLSLTGRSSGGASGNVMGKVNGEEITAQEFDATYRNLLEQQQKNSGGARITSVMDEQIKNSAWDQLVSNKLLEQELKRRGIRVTDDEIKQAAQYMPPDEFKTNPMFQTNGQFDPSKYQAFMASPAADDALLSQLEAYYRDIIPRSKLYFQSTAGTFVTDGQLWRIYSDQNEKASAKFVVIDPNTVVSDKEVTVSDAQMHEYFDAHKDQFPRLGRASVKYVVMDRTPSAQDSADARAKANDARAKLVAGASFDTIARQIQTDTTRGVPRTEIVVHKNGQLPPAYETAAFALPVGKVSDLIKTNFGFHVMRVKSRTDTTATTEQIVVPVELATKSEDALLDRADSLEHLIETEKLDAAAKQLGLTPGTTELAPPLAFIPGVGAPDEGINWAFNDAKIGDVSPVFEAPAAYYMLELTARTDSGTMSFDEAKLNVQRTLIDKEVLKRAQQKVNASIAGKDLATVATMYKSTVGEATNFTRGQEVTGMGRLNAAIGAAFGMKPGQTSSAIAAGGRLFVVQTTARTPADSATWAAQKNQQRLSALQALSDQRWQQYLEALKKSAKIVDNRKALKEKAQAQAAAQSTSDK